MPNWFDDDGIDFPPFMDGADESEGEHQARRMHTVPYRATTGGKTMLMNEQVGRYIKRERAEGKNPVIGLARGRTVTQVPSDLHIDCTVQHVHSETAKAYWVDLEFELEHEGVVGPYKMLRVWVPKSVSFVNGNMMRVPAWLLVQRELDQMQSNAMAESLLKNYR